jgi:hypothetical protein
MVRRSNAYFCLVLRSAEQLWRIRRGNLVLFARDR